ncbi:hypothetical protein CWS01_10830 [Niallia nealsonii]|uniref:Uncharacterized protein n=1 Tax=Niallia nealsonii TaxID=115979 RepID=A0A2N0Z1U7_9BACI|nr:hypothetical protein CWS01_10830 [Niallia nealsonii]
MDKTGGLEGKVRDSCGISGTGEIPHTQPEDAHRPPHGKRASLHCNQPTPLKAIKFTKIASLKQKNECSFVFFWFEIACLW